MNIQNDIDTGWTTVIATYQEFIPGWIRLPLWHVRHDLFDPMLLLVLMIVLLLERLWPARPQQGLLSVGLVQDLLWWVIKKALDATLLAGAYIAGASFYRSHFGFIRSDITSMLSPTLATVGAFLLLDFLEWGTHIIRHKIPALWALHAVHHSQRELNMFTAARFHPVEEGLVNLVRSIPFVIFGASAPVAVFFVFLTQWWSEFEHSNTRISFGPLEYVLVSPHWHRIHHSSDPRHKDKNFATIFSFWDRLFGTAEVAPDDYPATGIQDTAFPLENSKRPLHLAGTYVRQIAYPFVQLWGWLSSVSR